MQEYHNMSNIIHDLNISLHHHADDTSFVLILSNIAPLPARKSEDAHGYHQWRMPSTPSCLPLLLSNSSVFLTFKEHSTSIGKSRNHHIWTIPHIRPLHSVERISALALVSFSLVWTTVILFSTLH